MTKHSFFVVFDNQVKKNMYVCLLNSHLFLILEHILR